MLGAQAALYHHYGVPKHNLDEKCFGVFENRLIKPLVSSWCVVFNDVSMMPHSRHSETRYEDIVANQKPRSFPIPTNAQRLHCQEYRFQALFVFGHPEYDRDTLKLEYDRDVERGLDIKVPVHYYPDDDPTKTPVVSWRAEGQLIYTNWLNYYVYQTTPYDLRGAVDRDLAVTQAARVVPCGIEDLAVSPGMMWSSSSALSTGCAVRSGI